MVASITLIRLRCFNESVLVLFAFWRTLLLSHDLHSHMENQVMIMIGISIGLFLMSKLLFFCVGMDKDEARH